MYEGQYENKEEDTEEYVLSVMVCGSEKWVLKKAHMEL